MKQAVIDIGSNSMRLTLYEISEDGFKILFREKIMAGLAGYVESNVLTSDGIKCACDGLLEFKHTLEALKIKNVFVFATASLRNIANTDEAVNIIKINTDFDVEVISGAVEATLGYYGALQELSISNGILIDIGGASTELVTFKDNEILTSHSFSVGSLSLYKKCVKNILPGKDSMKKIKTMIKKTIQLNKSYEKETPNTFIAVGGTARGILKLAQKYYGLNSSCHSITAQQLRGLSVLLCRKEQDRINLILRLEPERIHTLVPGYMILQYIFEYFDADEMIVSDYGVREGYLCQKLLPKNIHTVKTEN